MKLFFSYSIFYQQKYGGISSYFVNLAKEYLKNQKDISIACKFHKNFNLKKIDRIVDGYRINYPFFFNKIIENTNEFFFIKKINLIKPDLIHFTYFYKNFKKIKNIKKIINCWDLTHEKFNKHSQLINLKKKNFLEADKILCPSFTVKKDLLSYYNLDENKIQVTYFSSDFEIEQIKSRSLQNSILYVGSRSDYKNFDKFIKSFSLSKKLKNDFNIIIFGGESPKQNGLDILKKYNIKEDKFQFVNGSNDDLKYYYKNARIFIYPSLYEGFGIPLIESMRMGCPVISSNGGALKEVGGSGISYFDPHDVDDIRSKLENFIYDDAKINAAINYGYKRSSKYSWKKCAQETYKAYESLF